MSCGEVGADGQPHSVGGDGVGCDGAELKSISQDVRGVACAESVGDGAGLGQAVCGGDRPGGESFGAEGALRLIKTVMVGGVDDVECRWDRRRLREAKDFWG
jgi:hypothetical protein